MTTNEIAFYNAREAARHNLEQELLARDQLAENVRHSTTTEAETMRSNLAKELETNRANVAKENETNRANVAKEKENKRMGDVQVLLGQSTLNTDASRRDLMDAQTTTESYKQYSLFTGGSVDLSQADLNRMNEQYTAGKNAREDELLGYQKFSAFGSGVAGTAKGVETGYKIFSLFQ